jgi:hypothetical protein
MNHLFRLLPQFFRQTWRMMASLLYGVQATDTVKFTGLSRDARGSDGRLEE